MQLSLVHKKSSGLEFLFRIISSSNYSMYISKLYIPLNTLHVDQFFFYQT